MVVTYDCQNIFMVQATELIHRCLKIHLYELNRFKGKLSPDSQILDLPEKTQ
jgi:hypothetical protein